MTVPITVAPVYSYCSKFWKIRTEAIKSFNGILDETITIDPYSPTALEKAKVTPVMKAGRRDGNDTRQKVSQGEAPRDQATSSSSTSMS